MNISQYANEYYLCNVIMMTPDGLKARMEELIGELEFHSRFFSMILAEEMATETELLEAIDEMLDEYIELSGQIKKLQS
ncbi:hypothetical protein NXY11_21810 [Parabacteroides faecis]|uniref:hypothetical protein n=1 Tax=Parabacteroides faecis TaxID=1217282 RepID=UPI0021641E22|nr:hypothetical protein [Parabacteroides faecis]MCS2890563.1 hypothetical protein [Parabacteroides faecis]UVQ45767.1 hypothetical protein NXY11_21810 [Parabacteroides faecis]